MAEENKGVVKRMSRTEDDAGRTVLRVIVDFYDGNGPNINNGTIWQSRPVTLTDDSLEPPPRVPV